MNLTEQTKTAIHLIVARCPDVIREAGKLITVVERNIHNPLIPNRLRILFDNALNALRERAEDFPHDEARRIADVIATLQALPEAKPGPDKQFPYRMQLRYDESTRQKLEQLKERSGNDASTISRSLIHEA